MHPTAPVVLEDDTVRLEPLGPAHTDGLARAALLDRATYGLTRVPAGPEAVAAYVEQALDEQRRGASVPFATLEARTGRVVGSTRFMAIERWRWHTPDHPLQRPESCADAVEIGSTWLAADAQRTDINTHAKLLMLAHAFERWAVHRVMLKTDARNVRSRTAILRLGARLDGVLRAHMPGFDGAIRDTAYFSILSSEWPDVKANLEARCARR